MGAGAAVEPAPRAPGPLAAVERRTTGTGAGAVSALPAAANAQPGAASPFTGGGGPSIRPFFGSTKPQGTAPRAGVTPTVPLRVTTCVSHGRVSETSSASQCSHTACTAFPRFRDPKLLWHLVPLPPAVPALPTLTNGPDTGTRSQHATVGRADTVRRCAAVVGPWDLSLGQSRAKHTYLPAARWAQDGASAGTAPTQEK